MRRKRARFCVGRTAAHREVVAADHDRPSLDLAAAEDEVGGHQLLEIVVLVIAGEARDLADFVERALVEQQVDPFADVVAAAILLALDPHFAAQLLGIRLALGEFVDSVSGVGLEWGGG